MDAADHDQWRRLGYEVPPDFAVTTGERAPDEVRHVAFRDAGGVTRLSSVSGPRAKVVRVRQHDHYVLPDERTSEHFGDAASAEAAWRAAVGVAMTEAVDAPGAIHAVDWGFAGFDPETAPSVAPDAHRGGCLRQVAFREGAIRREVALEPTGHDGWILTTVVSGPAPAARLRTAAPVTFATTEEAEEAWRSEVRRGVAAVMDVDVGEPSGPGR